MPLALRAALGEQIFRTSSFEPVLEMATESRAADIATAQPLRKDAGFPTIGRGLRCKKDKANNDE